MGRLLWSQDACGQVVTRTTACALTDKDRALHVMRILAAARESQGPIAGTILPAAEDDASTSRHDSRRPGRAEASFVR